MAGSEENTAFDADEMVGEWLELQGSVSDSVFSPEAMWPQAPPHILAEVRRRINQLTGMSRFMQDDSPLEEGYRPIPDRDYELVRRLDDGRTGFGEVWEARNEKIQRSLVFKFCKNPLSRSSRRALENEVRLVRQLKHPGIVKLLGGQLNSPIPFLVYQHVEGIDLAKLLEQRTSESGGAAMAHSPAEALGVILKIADIIAVAHSQPIPIVHRDLKPQNILVSNFNNLLLLMELGQADFDLRLARLKVTDFGIGGHSATGRNLCSIGRSIGRDFDGAGTRNYASPQQLEGEGADASDDVYSLGVIWYELLTGKYGRGAPSGLRWRKELLEKRMTKALLEVLERCIEKDREHRIPNAVEMGNEIRRVARSKGVSPQYSRALRSAIPNWQDWECKIYTNLTRLSYRAARTISKCSSEKDIHEITFYGLRYLPSNVAQALSDFKGKILHFENLAELTRESTHALSQWSGWDLRLTGLSKDFSVLHAEALAEWGGEELFLADADLSPSVAWALSNWKGRFLSIYGINLLTAESAKGLANWGRKVSPDDTLDENMELKLCVDDMTLEAADAFSEWHGKVEIHLRDRTRLSIATAEALTQLRQKDLSLGVEHLSVESAEMLATWRGRNLEIYHVCSLPSSVANALAKWQGKSLRIHSATNLTLEAAEMLASWKGTELSLHGFDSLAPAVADALAKWPGESLSIGEKFGRTIPTELLPETVRALVSWKGRKLCLPGLTNLCVDAAEALATWRGTTLELPGLCEIRPESLEALFKWNGQSIQLGNHRTQPIPTNPSQLLSAAAAGREAVVRFLLAQGADPNQKSPHGWTPLHLAAQNGRSNIVEILLDHKADIMETTTDEQCTALHLAVTSKHLQIVKQLLEQRIDVHVKNSAGNTALHLAADVGDIELIRLLVPKHS